MPIPLLRFPSVVLDEAIKIIEFRQQFIFSLCSKKMHQTVKEFRNKSIKLKLGLEADTGICIYLVTSYPSKTHLALSVEAMPEAHPKGWRTDTFEGVVFQEDQLQLRSYWKDVEVGTRALLEYLSNLFCASIERVAIEHNRFLWILDIVENLQGPGSYEACLFDTVTRLTDEQSRHLLVDLSPSKIYMYTSPSKEFKVERFRKSYHTFLQSAGDWLTIENLLTMDCVTLYVAQAFTSSEINRFFRHVLIDGGAPRLVDFHAKLNHDSESQRILDGLRDVLRPPSGREQFVRNDESWTFCGIRKRGGRSAYVCIKLLQTSISLKMIGN